MIQRFQVGDIVQRIGHSFCNIKVGESHPIEKITPAGSLMFAHCHGTYDQKHFLLVKGVAPTYKGKPKPGVIAQPAPELHPAAAKALVDFLKPEDDTYIAKRDQGKPQFDLLTEGCPQAQYGLVQVLTWAVEVKGYKPHSWQTVPEAIKRYTAALHRHLNAKARGDRYDHESGLLHDFHILACATFIAELEARIDGQLPVFKTEMPAKSAT